MYMWDILVYNKVLSLNADVPVLEQLIGDGRVMAHGPLDYGHYMTGQFQSCVFLTGQMGAGLSL